MSNTTDAELDEILEQYAESIGSYVNFGSPFNSDEDNIAGAEALYQTSYNEAKQAITSLIKELVAEAKPEKHIHQHAYGKPFEDAQDIAYNAAIDQFEQNLLKALEEKL